jgi:hypothetical protein
MQHEYWSVYEDGRKIADCGWERDAMNLCSMHTNRTYRKNKYLQDQVIDITATVDKQLPGQQGLPAGKIRVNGQELDTQQSLPESELIHFRV